MVALGRVGERGAGTLEWVGMAACSAALVLALLLAAPGWGRDTSTTVHRVVCAIVGQSSCPVDPGKRSSSSRDTVRLTTSHRDGGPTAWAGARGGGPIARTFGSNTGGGSGGVDVSRHLEWRSRADALTDFGFRDPKRCKGRSVQSAYCFGPDGTLRYCRDETIHDELRRRLQSQEVFCDAALHDDVILKTIPADCGVAPNVQVDGIPTDEWICRFVLDAGGIVFARCTETLPGQRTCIDVEQDAYRATDPKAVVCHSTEFSIARAGKTQTGLRACSSPGGSVYACAFEDTVDGALATDTATPTRCDQRIFPLDPEISCRLTDRKQPSPNVLETRCFYGTTPIVCLEYTRQPGDLVHCATTPTTPRDTNPCTTQLQVPDTLANPGRHLTATADVIDTAALLALFAFIRDRGPTVVPQLASCASPDSLPPGSAGGAFHQISVFVDVTLNGHVVAQVANGLLNPNLPSTQAQADLALSVAQDVAATNPQSPVHVEVAQDGHAAPQLAAATGLITFGADFWEGLWESQAAAIGDLIGPAVAFHAAHPAIAIHVIANVEEGVLVPSTPPHVNGVVTVPHLAFPNAIATHPADAVVADTFLALADDIATQLEAHPDLNPGTSATIALLAWLQAHPDFFPGPLTTGDVVVGFPPIAALIVLSASINPSGIVHLPAASTLEDNLAAHDAGALDGDHAIAFVATLLDVPLATVRTLAGDLY